MEEGRPGKVGEPTGGLRVNREGTYRKEARRISQLLLLQTEEKMHRPPTTTTTGEAAPYVQDSRCPSLLQGAASGRGVDEVESREASPRGLAGLGVCFAFIVSETGAPGRGPMVQ